MKMQERIWDCENEWIELICLKNPMQFGDQEIDIDGFKAVVKKSFDIISEVKTAIISGNCESSDAFESFKLVSYIARFVPDTCTEDESENKIFTACCIIADALVKYAGENINPLRKNLEVMSDDLPIIYDFETEDMSEITDLANEIPDFFEYCL